MKPVESLVALASDAERLATRAKCSFMINVLADGEASPAERAIARLSLLDELDDIVAALEPDDLARLGVLLNDVLESLVPVEETRFLPDGEVSGSDVIDGKNVPRVSMGVEGGSAETIVARFEATDGCPLLIESEYTLPGGVNAHLELRSAGTTIATTGPLPHGRHQVAELESVARRSGEVDLVLLASGDGDPVEWYGGLVRRGTSGAAATEAASQAVERVRSSAPAQSVFQPVTREPLTLSDVDRLMSLHNKFRGERIFIMGNGPSLNRTPLEKLDGEFVFGLNRISLLFERVSWRPTFFAAFDIRVVPDNAEEFSALDIEYKFFSARYKKLLGEKSNHYWHHTKGFYEGFEPAFLPSVVYSGFGGGGTIGVMAAEMAFFMGFREIYLIGTDVSYSIPKTVEQAGKDEFGDGVKLELLSTRDDDANHFDPRYFGKGKKWHNPNVREMKIGFGRAAAYAERHGGRILNATVGGELEEVERVEFDSLF